MRAFESLETKIKQLTPELVDELDNYLNYLLDKKKVDKKGKLTQNWAGGLKDVDYSSVELQKKALDWRTK